MSLLNVNRVQMRTAYLVIRVKFSYKNFKEITTWINFLLFSFCYKEKKIEVKTEVEILQIKSETSAKGVYQVILGIWKIHMYLQEQFNFHCPKELRVQVVPRTNAVWNNMAAR